MKPLYLFIATLSYSSVIATTNWESAVMITVRADIENLLCARYFLKGITWINLIFVVLREYHEVGDDSHTSHSELDDLAYTSHCSLSML